MEISFVIPVYNAEKTIEKCINSILLNIGTNGEIICIDDGSTDTSLSILKKYESQYPFIKVISKINEGPYIARKIGIEKATKDYVTFVDSDDWVEENYVSEINNVIQKKDIDIILFEYINDFEDKESFISSIPLEEGLYFDNKYKHMILPLLMEDGYLNGMCNKVFKRKILLRNNTEYRFNYGEDLIFQLGVFDRAKTLFFLKKNLYHYTHCRKDSLSNSKQNIELLLSMYRIRKNYQDKWKIEEKLINKPFLNLVCMCFLNDLKNLNFKAVFQVLKSKDIKNAVNKTDSISSKSSKLNFLYKFLKLWF